MSKENEGPGVDDNPTLAVMTHTPKCVGKLKRVTQRQQEQPLPHPFPLPRNFPPIVAIALKERKLTSKSRAKFVTALANAVFMYKSYTQRLENWRTWLDKPLSSGSFLERSRDL